MACANWETWTLKMPEVTEGWDCDCPGFKCGSFTVSGKLNYGAADAPEPTLEEKITEAESELADAQEDWEDAQDRLDDLVARKAEVDAAVKKAVAEERARCLRIVSDASSDAGDRWWTHKDRFFGRGVRASLLKSQQELSRLCGLIGNPK